VNGAGSPDFDTASHLAVALLVGLVIGMERGWRERDVADGGRVAGLRTFALLGLLGGVLGTSGPIARPWTLSAGLLATALLAAVSYRRVAASGNLSITTAVAMLLTFALGALAAQGAPLLAGAGAIVTAVLLNLKPTLHRWLQLIEYRELSAALQLLVLSVVIAPLLPNTGYGPYGSLNPYLLWWAVVVIAGLSFAGHVAIRLTGARRGLLLTGLLGGLASSTAATLALARQARADARLSDAAATGILAACGVMFLRMTVVLTVLAPGLARHMSPALIASAAGLLAITALGWKRNMPGNPEDLESVAPFDLSGAFGFALLLGAMSVLSKVAHAWAGPSALYGLAALSGVADVDAILISVARMSDAGDVSLSMAGWVVGAAAATNLVAQAVMAWVVGGRRVGGRVAIGYAVALGLGAAVAAWLSLESN
jgi:uncharacterized membrane protein (DUF4010 family)